MLNKISKFKPLFINLNHSKSNQSKYISLKNPSIQSFVSFNKYCFGSNFNMDESDQNPMPYIFLNKDQNLLIKKEQTREEDIQIWNKFLRKKNYNMQNIIEQLYFNLMLSISENNQNLLDQICEPKLSFQFKQGINWIIENVNKIEVLNKESFKQKELKIDVIDYFQTQGAYINRELNKLYQVVPLKSANRKNFYCYIGTSHINKPTYMSNNYILILKIESNLKINLITDKPMIEQQDALEEEVHFMAIECEAEKFQFTLNGLFKRLLKGIFRKRQMTDFDFTQWKIIDFDNCLNGNPHIETSDLNN